MSDKPEALRLADALENGSTYDVGSSVAYGWIRDDPTDAAAAELRRLHAVNADLLEALKAMLDLELRMRPPGYPPSDTVKAANALIQRVEGGSHG